MTKTLIRQGNVVTASDRFTADIWLKASRQMSLAYQRGLFRPSGQQEVWSERHREAEPWLEQPHAG